MLPYILTLLLYVHHSHTANAVILGALLVADEDVHVQPALFAGVEWLKSKVFVEKHEHIAMEITVLENVNVSAAEINTQFCKLVDMGCEAFFGSTNRRLSLQVEALCQQLHIPFFDVKWSAHNVLYPNNIAIRLMPERQLIDAIIDITLALKWTGIIVVYKDDYSVVHLRKLLENDDMSRSHLSLIKVDEDDFLDAVMQVAQVRSCRYVDKLNAICSKVTQVVLVLSTKDAYHYLIAALQRGMISVKYWYLLSSTDLKDSPADYLEMFRHNNVRIAGFDLLSPSINPKYKYKMLSAIARQHWFQVYPNEHYFPKTDVVLMFDAVVAFGMGYIKASVDDANFNLARCPSAETQMVTLSQGKRVYNWINQVKFTGLSGNVAFNQGRRKNSDFQLYQLGFNGVFEKLGIWGREACQCEEGEMDLNANATSLDHSRLHLSNFKSKPHMRVTTIEEEPYVMIKKNYKGKINRADVRREHLEGFCLDVLFLLSKEIGFSYSISLVEDRKYGKKIKGKNGTERWDGMIGEILSGKADLAVAPLTVNFQRANYLDFTKPFLTLGIGILFRIPTQQKPGLFSFLNPLSLATWAYIGGCSLVLTVAIYIIARLSPYEWFPDPSEQVPCCECQQHHVVWSSQHATVPPSVVPSAPPRPQFTTQAPPPSPRFYTTNYTFTNSFWYVVSTLLKGGNDFGPRAMSTRLLGGAWWVFTLVITSAYTANLAAVLTVDKFFLPIKSMEDLANQTKVQYGALAGGSTMHFFQESKLDTHKRMWDYIKGRLDEVSVGGNREGVARVMKGNYAYLMESSSLEYAMGSNCNLTQVGGVLGSRGYGVALNKGSMWTDILSRQILQLGEKGVLELLRSRWLKNKGAACGGKHTSMKEGSRALNMENVSGLFILLIGGIVLAIVCVIIEFCVMTRRNANIDQKNVCSLMGDELKFAVRLDPTKKKHTISAKCDHCDPPLNPEGSAILHHQTTRA